MDELRNAAKRKLDSILFGGNAREVMSGGGGWTTETSPDGRITMYVSPDGERMSRQEFESRANKTMTRQDAKSFLNAVAEGRGMPGYGVKDENLKVGVVLQPRGELQFNRPSTAFHNAQEARAGYSVKAAEAAEAAKNYRSTAARNRARGRADLAEQDELLAESLEKNAGVYEGMANTQRKSQALNLSRYNELEKGSGAAEMSPDELTSYQAAQSRAKPIPFPDKKK